MVTTNGAWSRNFLIWMAMLDEPMEVLGPPALVEVANAELRHHGLDALLWVQGVRRRDWFRK